MSNLPSVLSVVDEENSTMIDGSPCAVLALTVFPEGEPPRTSREAYCVDYSFACELVELYNKASKAEAEKEARRGHSAGGVSK